MIVGHFDSLGRPYAACRLIIPRFRLSQRVAFLVDTGADGTCLHPRDARKIGVPFPQLGNRRFSRGGGGRQVCVLSRARLPIVQGWRHGKDLRGGVAHCRPKRVRREPFPLCSDGTLSTTGIWSTITLRANWNSRFGAPIERSGPGRRVSSALVGSRPGHTPVNPR